MGIERLCEYRLWFPIINKWQKVHKKNWNSNGMKLHKRWNGLKEGEGLNMIII